MTPVHYRYLMDRGWGLVLTKGAHLMDVPRDRTVIVIPAT